jgi:ribosome-associated protein
MATTEVTEMLAAAAAACEDKKAEDIRILALDPAESGLADYFLICNGTNERQNVAITDEVEARLKRDFGTYPTSVEGRRQGDWILLDYVDFVVHVFLAERRTFYDIERLRKSARPLTPPEFDDELKTALAAKTRATRSKTAAPRKPAAKKSASVAAKKSAKPAAKSAAKKSPKAAKKSTRRP